MTKIVQSCVLALVEYQIGDSRHEPETMVISGSPGAGAVTAAIAGMCD